MTKTLYVFTNKYPFGNTDAPFLTRELESLKKRFINIVLIPLQADINAPLITNQYPLDTSLSLAYQQKIKLIPYLMNTAVIGEALSAISKNKIEKLQKLWWSLKVATKVAAWALSNIQCSSASLLYSYWFSSLAIGLAFAKQKGLNIPLVVRAHRGDLYEERTLANYFPLRSYSLGQIDRLFLISQDGLNYVSKKYPKFRGKFTVSRLGVSSPDNVSPASHDPQTISIVSCSYLRTVKRIDFFCDVLAKFSAVNSAKTIIWNHFGGGDLFDTELIIEKIKSFPENVRSKLWGNVSNNVITEFYSRTAVDFFVSVSSSEGIPVSMMEALSFGIPIIATDVGGVNELVNEDNGLLLEKDFSIAQVVEAMTDFLHSNYHISKRAAARETWAKKYNAEQNYLEFGERLVELVSTQYR